MSRIGIAFQTDKRPGEYAHLARIAEAHGVDALSVYADLMYQPPLPALLEMAGATERVVLGPACLNPYTTHPYEIAGFAPDSTASPAAGLTWGWPGAAGWERSALTSPTRWVTSPRPGRWWRGCWEETTPASRAGTSGCRQENGSATRCSATGFHS
jgi:hypothetical protein